MLRCLSWLSIERRTKNEKLLWLSCRKYECCEKQCQQKQDYYDSLLSLDLGVCNDSVLVFTSGSDAMGYSLMFLWFILPISTFIVSIVIGKNNFWGKGKWAFTLFFGVMYMLAEYGTFKMANNIAFYKLNAPDLGMIVAGAIISAIGMLVGSLWNKKRHNQKNN